MDGMQSRGRVFAPDVPSSYRMPAHFGPTPGPRQNLEDFHPDHRANPRRQTAIVEYATKAEPLRALLPPGFDIWGEAMLMMEVTAFQGIEWLAGRGYSMGGVRVPAQYQCRNQKYCGLLQLVLWENLTDPILTGREELGAPKLFADIPPVREFNGELHYEVAWQGHTFMRLSLRDLVSAVPPPPLTIDGRMADGIMYYKYIPRTFLAGEHDVAYATLTPRAGNHFVVDVARSGAGEASFVRSTFQQLPTMYHIVNALADLPLLEVRNAFWIGGAGGRDHSDTTIMG